MEDWYRLSAIARIRQLQGIQKEGKRPSYLKGLSRERILHGARHTDIDTDEEGVCLLQFLFVGVICVDNGTVVGTGVADNAVGFPPEVCLVLYRDYSY